MKRLVFLASLVILSSFSGIGGFCSQEKTRILFDDYHASCRPSEYLVDISTELKNRGYIVMPWDRQIDFFLLSQCDVFVVFIPSESYFEEEKEAIRKFVENGGNLIIFGDYGDYMKEKNIFITINSISSIFGIKFNADVVLDSEKNREGEDCHPTISNFKRHPVTEGVKSIGYICGCSLTLESSATALAFGNSSTTANGQKGEDIVVLAVAEYGKGKVMAIGDQDFLVGSRTPGYEEDFLSFMDNKKLALNMFEWLSFVYKMTIEADELASEGHRLFSQRVYSQAKLQFEKAKKLYLEANMTEKVSEMQGMIAKCDKALDAETAYQKGMEYYSKKEYDNALTEFQRSKSLYDEIEDTKGSDKTQLMIDKCGGALKTLIAEAAYQEGMECYKHHEYDNAITKFEEAITLYEELENTEKAEELQNKLQEARDKNATKNRIFVIFGIFAAIVVVYLTVRMFVRRSKISGGSDILHLEKVYCSSCGKENIKGISYCRHCKAPLKSLDELEKEKILEDVSKKFISGEISEGEYHRIMNELKESL